MLQPSPQTSPIAQADIQALDALFRRIAARGRKVRQAQQNEPKKESQDEK
jgi:hypothetical protein